MAGLTVENAAPSYWQEDGGAHWTVTASCGANASCLRVDRRHKWACFDPLGNQMELPHTLSDDEAICQLRRMIVAAMLADIATVV